jgi:hypothetical protein
LATVSLVSPDGEAVYLEVEEQEMGLQHAGGDERVAPRTLEEALDRIRPIANAVIQKINSIDIVPDELEVKFGIKLSADANIIVSKTSAEANFEFKLVWKKAAAAK